MLTERPSVSFGATARWWEPQLVEAIKTGRMMRILDRHLLLVPTSGLKPDVLVLGAESPGFSPTAIRRWRAAGTRVLGLHPPGDRPAMRQLERGGADLILSDSTPVDILMAAAISLGMKEPSQRPEAPVAVVTGPRGAPGRTEIAIALSWAAAGTGRVLLVDLDAEAPGVAIRLGLNPRPDLVSVGERLLDTGKLDRADVQSAGPIDVAVGSLERLDSELMAHALRVIDTARLDYETVVVDAGPNVPPECRNEQILLVASTTPQDITRSALAARYWEAGVPQLILNRAEAGTEDSARRWIGLDPSAVVPDLPGARSAGRWGGPPDPKMVSALSRVVSELHST